MPTAPPFLVAPPQHRFVLPTIVARGLFLPLAGLWCLADPRSSAFRQSSNKLFVHDAGAFQIGIAAISLLVPIGRDRIIVLGGFRIGNGFDAIRHWLGMAIAGGPRDAMFLGAGSAFTIPALAARGRELATAEQRG